MSRLVIARETVEEILGEATWLVEEPEFSADWTDIGPAESGVVGVVTVPRWRPGARVAVLPQAYGDANAQLNPSLG
ncbi:hypothetical protein [Nonomuraea sp. NPDC049646]|uniref:hypothetical protein n=1 Tax=unclassified Nonomuraea TaxID=2593643 RepID=UPI003791FD05